MFDETAESIHYQRYRGMNPEFVKRVWEKRRLQEYAQSAAERKRLREAAQAMECKAKRVQRNATQMKIEDEWEKAQREEIFRAQFLESIAQLRMAHMVEKYKSAAAVAGAMEVRYRAAEIIQFHVNRSPFTYSEVISNIRTRPIVAVRQAAMADVYVLCPHLSLPQIGRLFGGRDHTTVLHAVMKMGVWRGDRHKQAA
jgi:chromosomal replication initiation ATPase DnaA